MKKFIYKISILLTFVYVPVGFYEWGIKPNISGDIGRIGQIPFGKEYCERIESPYKNLEIRVHTIKEGEEIPDSVITIGDSFSNDGIYCYNYFLARELDADISNITGSSSQPEQLFIRLVNQKKIHEGTIAIVESAERTVVNRLTMMNLNDSITAPPQSNQKGQSLDVLDETLMWIRTSLGIKNPVLKFHTNRELFSHKSRHGKLYIYDSKWDEDGDLRYAENPNLAEDLEKAWNNIYALHAFAAEKGIRLIYLIPADKYDVYEPFIVESHIANPTLRNCPDESWILNTKPILQSQVSDGIKDVYRFNDTHWSPIGSCVVAKELSRRIKVLDRENLNRDK